MKKGAFLTLFERLKMSFFKHAQYDLTLELSLSIQILAMQILIIIVSSVANEEFQIVHNESFLAMTGDFISSAHF